MELLAKLEPMMKTFLGRALRSLLLSALTLGMSGCARSGKMESALVLQIAQSCRMQSPCQIRIDSATDFDWGKMYVFQYNATKADRERALGMNDDGYQDLQRQLVFVNNGRIVFQESEPTNIEHPIKNEVVFDIPGTETFASYPRGTLFSVQQLSSEAGAYFKLTRVIREGNF
jgi:hypothetical protein